MVLPNFFIPGAMKSGTTALHHYLEHHDDIFMSDPKEPHFFCDDKYFMDRRKEYCDLFEKAGSAKWRGESSVGYMVYPNVIERLASEIKQPRFIFTLRNPIDRVFSHYRWLYSLKREHRSLRDAVVNDAGETPDFEKDRATNFYRYDERSRYGVHVAKFITQFGINSILVVTSEDLRNDHMTTLNKCAQFLEIAPFPVLGPIWKNLTGFPIEGTKYGSDNLALGTARFLSQTVKRHVRLLNVQALSREDRLWLCDRFSDDVAHLRQITGCNFDKWKDDFPN